MARNEVTTEYCKIARYYDLVHQGLVDYRAEAERMHELFGPHLVRRILDLACGTGSHLLELARLGYQCVGTDLSPEMIEVAREKADGLGVKADFYLGDMCNYRLGQTFDAVLGLYAFTTLIDDDDFFTGLINARKALREGGLFYFNLLNADFEEIMPATGTGDGPPALYLDVVVNEPDIRLVRLNQVAFHGEVQDWTTVYFADEGDGVRLISGKHKLRCHHLNWVENELKRAGYDLASVTYSDIQGLKRWDMFILAQDSKG